MYSFLKATLFHPLARFGFRARIEGLENLPAEGGAVLASNHLHAVDSVIIPSMLPRRVTFLAKAELFSGQGSLTSRFVGWFLKAIGIVPVDRGGRGSAASLQRVTDVLSDGRLVVIYPEGTRSPDGRLYRGKTGMARMVLASGVPVLPVGLSGTETVKGPFGMPWVRRPVISIGRPLTFDELADRQTETKVLRHVTDQVMTAIQDLTGQEYVNVYAARVKAGDLSGADLEAHVMPRPPVADVVP